MKTLSALIGFFERSKTHLTLEELMSFPTGTLGHKLGLFLFNNSCEAEPVPEKEDIHRLLITKEISNKEEVAMQYYLFGNGDYSLFTIFGMITGGLLYLHYLPYFIKRYREGKNALRFYDVDCFRMLHLPVEKIKDAFMIK